MQLSLLWCHQESNRGHKDFQSFALPTELWHHHLDLVMQRYGLFFVCANVFRVFAKYLCDFILRQPVQSLLCVWFPIV